MYQALYRKYRPKTFLDVVGQAHITDTLQRQVETARLSHAYLFTGTRGTGKTSCAKILARAVNCQAPQGGNPCNQCPACIGIDNGSILDVLELDAASNNGVDHVRALRDEAIYTPANVKKRVYIVDEVHMLSTAAFNALLKILEEPPAHLMFILATTELHKVPATIKSRCQQFAFKRILPSEIASRLAQVAGEEGIALTPDGGTLLARLADGGMRDALSLLDQCVDGTRAVDEACVLEALGMAGNLEIAALMGHVAAGETGGALEKLSSLHRGGKEIRTLLGELSGLARDLLIRKTAPQGGATLLTGGYDETVMRTLSEGFTVPRLVQMIAILQTTAGELQRSVNQRTDGELAIIRLADETLDGSVLGLSARMERLEQMMEYPPQVTQKSPPVPQAKAAVQAPAPLPDDDAPPPPWEAEAPPPPWEEEPPAAPPAPMAASVQPQPTGDLWHALLPALKGKVSPVAWPFLSNADMTAGRYDQGVLTLVTSASVTKTMIDKPEVLAVIAQAAESRVGCPVTVRVTEKQAASGDKMNDLMAMGAMFGNH